MMRVFAEVEIRNGMVKFRTQIDDVWYQFTISEFLFDRLQQRKGEVIKQIMMIQ